MRRDPRMYLWDMQQADSHIVQFTAGRTFADYVADVMFRSAVERQFEIIGEALAQIIASIRFSPHGSATTRASSASEIS